MLFGNVAVNKNSDLEDIKSWPIEWEVEREGSQFCLGLPQCLYRATDTCHLNMETHSEKHASGGHPCTKIVECIIIQT